MRPEFENTTVSERIKNRNNEWRQRKADNYSTEQADMDRLSDEHEVPTEILPKKTVGRVFPGLGGGLFGGGGSDF